MKTMKIKEALHAAFRHYAAARETGNREGMSIAREFIRSYWRLRHHPYVLPQR